jgi:hypothetical protein
VTASYVTFGEQVMGGEVQRFFKVFPQWSSRNNSQNGEVLAPNIQMPEFGKYSQNRER